MADGFDIVVVGAGAAGLAALNRLKTEPLSVIALEARERVGGRAFTRSMDGLALDAGCGWLHSADQNVLVEKIAAKGFSIDRTLPAWGRQSGGLGFSARQQRQFAKARNAFEDRLAAAAETGVDQAASDFLPPHGRWNGRLNAFSAYYNGAEWDEVSVLDYAAYEDTGINWRVREGYGRGIAALAMNERVRLGCAVELIDHQKTPIRVATPAGDILTRAVIITTPSSLLAEERMQFLPKLDAKTAAAAGLPLGLADKAFLQLRRPGELPAEGHLSGRADNAETGSYYLRPFGRDYIEVYFGGDHAHALEKAGPGAMTAFAIDELVHLVGSGVRSALEPIFETAWGQEAWSKGSYSHALPGSAGARKLLAEPHEDRLFFAGEATHPRFYSTAHGAWESGVRAAEEALAAFSPA